MRANMDGLVNKPKNLVFLGLNNIISNFRDFSDEDWEDYPVVLYKNPKISEDRDDYISTFGLDYIVSRLLEFMEALDYTFLGSSSHILFHIPVRVIDQNHREETYDVLAEKYYALFKRLADPEDLVLIEGKILRNLPIFRIERDDGRCSMLILLNEDAIKTLIKSNYPLETFFKYPVSTFSVYGLTRYGLKRVSIDDIRYAGRGIYIFPIDKFLEVIKRTIEDESKKSVYIT